MAGLAAAIGLRRAGLAVDLVEIDRQWSSAGVGIVQEGNVLRAMAALGLAREYVAAGFPYDRVRLLDAAGAPVDEIDGAALSGPDYPAMHGIDRDALHELLRVGAQRGGVRIRLGASVATLESRGAAVRVCCTDGIEETYGLVVGADGLHSRLRALAFGEQAGPRYTGQAVWRYALPRAVEVDCLTKWLGPRGEAGMCPVSDRSMYLFVTTPEPQGYRPTPYDAAEQMRARLEPYGAGVAALSPLVENPEAVAFRPVQSLLLRAPWYRGRIVLIGDAAHAGALQLGHGAGMAIEDAVVLAQEYADPQRRDDALQRFMQRRYPRVQALWAAAGRVTDAALAGRDPAERAALLQQMHALTAAGS